MESRITKWGTGLVIRIPQKIARRFDFKDRTLVNITTENDHAINSPQRPHYKLHELLIGMTPKAMHETFEWESDVGRESV